MHAQQYCLVLESLPSAVLGRRRLALRDGGVDDSSDSEHSESGFTSTPRTKLSPCTTVYILTPKARHRQSSKQLHISTRVLHQVYVYKLQTRLVVLITQLQSLRGAGCARRRYQMHVIYSAFWISVYDTLSIIYIVLLYTHTHIYLLVRGIEVGCATRLHLSLGCGWLGGRGLYLNGRWCGGRLKSWDHTTGVHKVTMSLQLENKRKMFRGMGKSG